MHERLKRYGLDAHLGKQHPNKSHNNSAGDEFGWRDVAFYIARETHTPAPIVMKYTLIEAFRWLAVIHRHFERERKEQAKEK